MQTRFLTPTAVSLRDLAPEGRELIYTRDSGEMNDALKDLIGANPYAVNLKIAPMGNSFDLKGEIHTELDLQCSFCAGDFKMKVDLKPHELIVIQKPFSKGDSQGKANHAHEMASGGPDYIALESDVFDAAEYVHEAIALNVPMQPRCKEDCAVPDTLSREWLTIGPQKNDDFDRQSPFQVLEKLKLKS